MSVAQLDLRPRRVSPVNLGGHVCTEAGQVLIACSEGLVRGSQTEIRVGHAVRSGGKSQP